ncbi:MAG: HAMP domain-containing histidine kinase [Deltaproteobacteria bacterium]|nr:MAG: HAMP domain-containing histidine kinase [Deltaproteobacteria bacterium]
MDLKQSPELLKKYPILYVDDERANLIVLEQNFNDRYTILTAISGEDALAMLHEHEVAVLLTDYRMPKMTGVDLAEQVALQQPDTVRIILTAFGDLEISLDAINRGQVSRFIQKPWNFDLIDAILLESIQTYHNRKHVKDMQMRLLDMERVASVGLAAAGAAHDIKSANHIIMGNVEMAEFLRNKLLETMPQDPALLDLLNDMASTHQDTLLGTKMLQRLVNTLLSVSRPSETVQEPFNVVEVIENAVLLSRVNILRKGRMSVDLPSEPVMLQGSPHRLLQLLNNLLTNACQALNKNRPIDNRVSVSLQQTDTHVCVMIRDTGKGIPEDVLPNIFHAFYTTKGQSGNGLGLAICQQVAKEFEGNIFCESTLGKGTTFTITLPLQRTSQP